ncbi:MAG TPA: peptidylprolyl isomerase [Thermoanaerobaculia bacterium]|nr:peptidylprolyl isomerase [Thermoanaerobaculia bacterium]
MRQPSQRKSDGLLLAAFLGAALASGCHREQPPAPDVVARISGKDVHYARFEGYLQRSMGDPDTVLASDVLSELFDQFLDEQLLAHLAVERGLVTSIDHPRQAADALLKADPEAEPAEAQVAAYYNAHRQEFARPERVRLKQILVEDRQTAQQAARDIAAGASFEAVARRVTRGQSLGGFQGVLSRGDLPPAFADAIFSLKPGEVSRVMAADYGFHLFQVLERLPAEVAPLDEVRDGIRARLRQERADRRLATLVQECRSHYTVVVYGRNLPFNYEGFYGGSKKKDRRR